ncbi:hypothetical protein F5Y14DRAFT_16449 [Nemania sp. NC0429]|nr:hypothetical protein F5Y14DRAFT_16449 [Nemania sp. NC0429]
MHIPPAARALPALQALLALLALLTIFPSSISATTQRPPKDAVLLSTVQSLTLRADKPTTHRRAPAIPQLRCVSSPRVCALHTIDVLRCENRGGSYGGAEDVEWSCAASLPPELRLGATDVLCEGYAGPDDPYVLRGSCGVEYRLVLTELGERRFPDVANAGSGGWFSGWGSGSGSGSGSKSGNSAKPLRSPDPDDSGSTLGAWFFGILFVGVLLWIVYSAWTQAGAPGAAQRRPRNNRFFGGGGGGGFDPGFGPGGGGGGGYGGRYGDDPPPPYSKYSSSSSQAGWRPGFWTGLASGAAAAHLAGNRGGRRQESQNFYGGGSSSSSGIWGSRPGPSSDSGAASTSSSRYTSTGFGSTSRR